eukprot:1826497-Rhodomonas_salina.1
MLPCLAVLLTRSGWLAGLARAREITMRGGEGLTRAGCWVAIETDDGDAAAPQGLERSAAPQGRDLDVRRSDMAQDHDEDHEQRRTEQSRVELSRCCSAHE